MSGDTVLVVTGESGPYATCQDCGVDLPDRDAVKEHTRSTLAPTGEGSNRSSHRVRIVNPTEDERRAGRVRMRIADALDDLYRELDDRISRGEFTAAEVKAELSWFHLGDGWDAYTDEEPTP